MRGGREADERGDVLVGGIDAVFLLVRGACLSGDAIAHDLGAGRGAAPVDRHLEHRANRCGSSGGHHAPRRGRYVHAKHGERDQVSVAREDAVGTRELHQRHRYAVPVGHRRLLDRSPAPVRPELSGRFSGKTQAGRGAEAHVPEHFPHRLGRECKRDLRRADIGGFLDDLRHRERTLEMGVVDGGCPNAQASRGDLDHGIRPHSPPFKSEGDGKGFKRRTGFESIGQRTVPKLRAGKLVAVVGVVCREIREREQLARVDVDHDDAARLRSVLSDRRFQLGESEVLDAGIQSKSEVVPVLRGLDRLDVLDRLAEPVLDHPAAAGLAGEPVLKRELDTLLADVVHAREAEHVRGDFAAWVIAPVLAVLE